MDLVGGKLLVYPREYGAQEDKKCRFINFSK